MRIGSGVGVSLEGAVEPGCDRGDAEADEGEWEDPRPVDGPVLGLCDEIGEGHPRQDEAENE